MTKYVGLGPCAFCGYPDAGHRIWDSIAERLNTGELLASIAEDYDLSPSEAKRLARRSEFFERPAS